MKTIALSAVLAVGTLLAGAAVASAQTVGGTATARLRAFEEVPALSAPGGGRFNAIIADDGSVLSYEFNYFYLEGVVTQAHIHFAQRGVNGGIVVFLCSNLGNGPAGTPSCPGSPGSISGSIRNADVIGPEAQGLGAGEASSLWRAIRAGIAYVNVHSDKFPGGEIRGQLLFTPKPQQP